MFFYSLGTASCWRRSALNQLLEQEYDAKMLRTQDRPLPSGRLQSLTVLIVVAFRRLSVGLPCLGC